MPPVSNHDCVVLTFEDGRQLSVHPDIADHVHGLDEDIDLLITLGTARNSILTEDGEEKLIALTPCCNATSKGSAVSDTGLICRACYQEVAVKYGGTATLAVRVTPRTDGQ